MLIKVKVFPNSKKEEIIEKPNNNFEVRVKEKPIMGKANKEAIRILASYFRIPEAKIKLIKGFRQRNKVFKI